jgi:hypothetical protein
MQTDTSSQNKGEQQNAHTSQQAIGIRKDTEEAVVAAHEQAEADMEKDPDLNSEPDPAADLDEGEIARLDNDNERNPPV